MKLRECYEKRLLRKDAPSLEASKRSIEVAESKLAEARKALDYDLIDSSVIQSYTAMFHAARAILFRDGVMEKSHVCLVEYLRENYVKKGKISESYVNILDSTRVDRHETLYGLTTRNSRTDAEYSYKKAMEFVSMAKSVLEKIGS